MQHCSLANYVFVCATPHKSCKWLRHPLRYAMKITRLFTAYFSRKYFVCSACDCKIIYLMLTLQIKDPLLVLTGSLRCVS